MIVSSRRVKSITGAINRQIETRLEESPSFRIFRNLYRGLELDLPVNPSFFLQTPHFFFCFLAGGCEDSSSSGVFVSTLSDDFESIVSGVSVVGLVGGWVGVGFDRIGFIRPAIASVTEPEVLSGVDSRAKIIESNFVFRDSKFE